METITVRNNTSPANTIDVHNDIKREITEASVQLQAIQQPIQSVCNAARKLELSIDALCSLEDWIDSTCLALSSMSAQVQHLNEAINGSSEQPNPG